MRGLESGDIILSDPAYELISNFIDVNEKVTVVERTVYRDSRQISAIVNYISGLSGLSEVIRGYQRLSEVIRVIVKHKKTKQKYFNIYI